MLAFARKKSVTLMGRWQRAGTGTNKKVKEISFLLVFLLWGSGVKIN
jgi:hypothetical protein